MKQLAVDDKPVYEVGNRWKFILDFPPELHDIIMDYLKINDLGSLADAGELEENLAISIHARFLITLRYT